MPTKSEGKTPSGCDGKGAARHAHATAGQIRRQTSLSTATEGRCVCCEVRDGLPTVHATTPGHYISRQGGSRMLVIDRRPGQRLRINGTTEIVVLEIHPRYVKIAIETFAGESAKLQGVAS